MSEKSYTERLHTVRPNLVHKTLKELGYVACPVCKQPL